MFRCCCCLRCSCYNVLVVNLAVDFVVVLVIVVATYPDPSKRARRIFRRGRRQRGFGLFQSTLWKVNPLG